VLAPLRVIYARSVPVAKASVRIYSSEQQLQLPESTRILIRYFTSHFNDCSFCSNINAFGAEKARLEREQLMEIMNYSNSNRFSSQEKSLLAYLEEINTIKTVSDETFARLRKYYTEKEVVEITWINATENYFNLMAKPLGLRSDELKASSGRRLKREIVPE
jgi:alkylhydroperoxidase family enzyme